MIKIKIWSWRSKACQWPWGKPKAHKSWMATPRILYIPCHGWPRPGLDGIACAGWKVPLFYPCWVQDGTLKAYLTPGLGTMRTDCVCTIQTSRAQGSPPMLPCVLQRHLHCRGDQSSLPWWCTGKQWAQQTECCRTEWCRCWALPSTADTWSRWGRCGRAPLSHTELATHPGCRLEKTKWRIRRRDRKEQTENRKQWLLGWNISVRF